MRIIARTFIITAGVGGLVGSASAADMTAADIKAFLSGKTVYSGEHRGFRRGATGAKRDLLGRGWHGLSSRRQAGTIMHGKWEIKGNTNCPEWKERPNTGCVRYDKAGDAITVIDVNTGQVRAKVVKTAPGNAEKLAP